MANYSVLLVAALIVISVPVLTLFIITPLVRASRSTKVKLEPYECGIPATSLAFDHRFSVRYFIIAVLFIVFDVETVFLFPGPFGSSSSAGSEPWKWGSFSRSCWSVTSMPGRGRSFHGSD